MKESNLLTGNQRINELLPLVRSFLRADILETRIDGDQIRGYRSPDSQALWLRDHSDMLRTGRYFEKDITSAVTHFAETQAANGRIFDFFTTHASNESCQRENWTQYVRVPVEADVEYRFVKAVYLAWQASGNDGWLISMLEPMKRALNYAFTHPDRFDPKTGLIKRPFTIDTWDFAYTAGEHPWLQFQIDDKTFWGLFHGDNSGFYEALVLLANMLDHLNKGDLASEYRMKARLLRERANDLCWNGKFYKHFEKITPLVVKGVDESIQLSMSNPMNINRGLGDHAQAVSIIREYLERKEKTRAFAEWFSIDPPFPDGIFGDPKLIAGAYINGGIFPLAGGELARAAFEHGFEQYGTDILLRYQNLVSASGESFLWYFPDGTPSTRETSTSPDALPTDGWGSSAMLYALTEGLAGVSDLAKEFRKVKLAPRWPAAAISEVNLCLVYPASGAWFEYHYHLVADQIEMEIRTPHSEILVHLLLPDRSDVTSVRVDGRSAAFLIDQVEGSRYVNFKMSVREKSNLQVILVR